MALRKGVKTMNEEATNKFIELVQTYGAEAVLAGAKQLLDGKRVEPEFLKTVNANNIDTTFQQLDRSLQLVLDRGEEHQDLYKNRGQLLHEKMLLETDVKLTEANAIMKIQGNGKDQYVLDGEIKIPLTNETARDAYRRKSSATARQRLATVEAELAKIESDIWKSKDTWGAVKETLDILRAKANLQTALLYFLSSK